MQDHYGREIDYMRLSITQRCNLRCKYCMPEGISMVSHEEILSYEEIETICREAVKIGIRKFKVTGGEPLVRKNCPEFIQRLKNIPGVSQVTLTTNGILLERYAKELRQAGIDGINVSLDTLDADIYQKLAGRDGLADSLRGIDAAFRENIPVKINTVLLKGYNDANWENLLSLAQERPIAVRFIEMMPIGYGKCFETVSNEWLLAQLKKKYPAISPDTEVRGNGPAVYYKIPGYSGRVGFVSAIHGKFCDSCNRLRLTARGGLKACLGSDTGTDLREIIRNDSLSAEEMHQSLQNAIKDTIAMKPQAHCFDEPDKITEQNQMIQIGG